MGKNMWRKGAYIATSVLLLVWGCHCERSSGSSCHFSPPTILSISPSSLCQKGGTPVVLTGSGFSHVSEVFFDGTQTQAFTVESDTRIVALVPPHAEGIGGVSVENPCGSASLPIGILYYGSPKPSGILPSEGCTGGGGIISIFGTGFTDVISVSVNGANIPPISVSPTEITVQAPVGAPGAANVNVEITTTCGSGSLAASYMFSDLAFLATHPVVASEFIEQEGMAVNINSTILAVSQSGETTDTLAAVDHARSRAATILGLTNAVGSTLTRVSRVYIVQQSGPEIGVAATKTFTAQLSVLAQLALRVAKIRGKVGHRQIEELEAKIRQIPDVVENTIRKNGSKAEELAKKIKDKQVFFFLGRGISSATALEGRLKLMEIAYIPSIAYPAGESKHGPISLIEPGFPVVFVCPKDETHKTIIGNIMEMKARGASIISVIEEGDEEIKKLSDEYFEVAGSLPEALSPIAFVAPLQLLAYYMAVERGCNPDKPRNLAKSVTVR